MRVRWHPAAQAELREQWLWYEERRHGTGRWRLRRCSGVANRAMGKLLNFPQNRPVCDKYVGNGADIAILSCLWRLCQ